MRAGGLGPAVFNRPARAGGAITSIVDQDFDHTERFNGLCMNSRAIGPFCEIAKDDPKTIGRSKVRGPQ